MRHTRLTGLPCLAVVMVSVLPQLSVIPPAARLLDVPGAPVEIVSFKPTYQKETNAFPSGIHHVIEYRNRSNKVIVAVRIGLVSFSVFNEHISSLSGVDTRLVAPTQSQKARFIDRTPDAFVFHTGVAFVRSVRFIDGEVWHAEPSAITQGLQAIEQSFDPKRATPDIAKSEAE